MTPPASPHRFSFRVYYEDTDLAGIVYYANYLRFIERARTEWVREMGIDQGRLRAEAGIVFAVRRIEADYLAPARFDDMLTVETGLAQATAVRVVLTQRVLRGETPLFAATVTIVALSDTGRPARLPAAFRRALEDLPR
jgi:acyl-CoA thioester hydrolase